MLSFDEDYLNAFPKDLSIIKEDYPAKRLSPGEEAIESLAEYTALKMNKMLNFVVDKDMEGAKRELASVTLIKDVILTAATSSTIKSKVRVMDVDEFSEEVRSARSYCDESSFRELEPSNRGLAFLNSIELVHAILFSEKEEVERAWGKDVTEVAVELTKSTAEPYSVVASSNEIVKRSANEISSIYNTNRGILSVNETLFIDEVLLEVYTIYFASRFVEILMDDYGLEIPEDYEGVPARALFPDSMGEGPSYIW